MPRAADPPPEPQIRPACRRDLEAVLRIEREHFSVPWNREYVDAELHNRLAHFFVACAGESGDVAGYLLFWSLAGEIELHRIAVASAWRRRGIASRLLDRLLQAGPALGCERVVLEVRASNRAAIAFYEKRGFSQAGRRRNYYSRPDEDALVYSLALGKSGGGS